MSRALPVPLLKTEKGLERSGKGQRSIYGYTAVPVVIGHADSERASSSHCTTTYARLQADRGSRRGRSCSGATRPRGDHSGPEVRNPMMEMQFIIRPQFVHSVVR